MSDSRSHFEINVSLPSEPRFAETARELAIHAARHAGCGEDEARAFGRDVEGVIRDHMEHVASGASIPLVVRRVAGPVEVLVDGRTLILHA